MGRPNLSDQNHELRHRLVLIKKHLKTCLHTRSLIITKRSDIERISKRITVCPFLAGLCDPSKSLKRVLKDAGYAPAR